MNIDSAVVLGRSSGIGVRHWTCRRPGCDGVSRWRRVDRRNRRRDGDRNRGCCCRLGGGMADPASMTQLPPSSATLFVREDNVMDLELAWLRSWLEVVDSG